MDKASDWRWCLWVVVLALAGGCLAPERVPVAASAGPDTLEIKFREGQRIRLRNGEPTDLEGRALTHPRARELLRQVAGGHWTRSHEVSEEALDAMRTEGERNTGERLPDQNLYFRLRLPPGLDADRSAEAFRQLPEVESVQRVPRPVPPPSY